MLIKRAWFCPSGTWPGRIQADVPREHGPLWPPLLIKLQKWPEKRQDHTGPKGQWEPLWNKTQPRVRETPSQEPIQPTGMSGLLPWVGVSLAPSLHGVLTHAPKFPVQAWPRVSYTLCFAVQYKPAHQGFTKEVSTKQSNLEFPKWPRCSSSSWGTSTVLSWLPSREKWALAQQESSPICIPHAQDGVWKAT